MLPSLITAIPGPRSRELADRLRRHESRNVTYVAGDFPVFWDRAEGVNVWDVDGNRLLDFTSAFGVSGLGHSPPPVVDALRDQAERLLHGMGDVHPTEGKVALCEQLSALTFERWKRGPAKSILGNSGFEAVEAALKTAHIATGRPRVVTFEGAYHGLGYGALAAGSLPAFRKPFTAQLAPIGATLPFPAADPEPFAAKGAVETATTETEHALERVRSEIEKGDVGAVLLEPVQGRGGKVIVHPAFLRGLRDLCDETKTLLVFDEILCGLNRTGKLFACDHFDVTPDILCLGKALTSGYPLSACVAPAEVMDAWPESTGEALHTSTFLGNPLGCAMALASLERHADPATATRVASAGRTLRRLLGEIDSPRAGQVRGLGLMLGLELVHPESGAPDGSLGGAIVPQALADGLIVLSESPEGNILGFVPPFDVGEEEMTWVRDRVQEYLVSLPGSVS